MSQRTQHGLILNNSPRATSPNTGLAEKDTCACAMVFYDHCIKVYYLFCDKTSLFRLGWLRTHYVDQAILELTERSVCSCLPD